MRYLTILLAILVLGGQSPSPGPAQSLPLEKIKLPPGFAIDVYATGVENARQMALGDNGTLFVGSQQAGRVHAVVDRGQDNKADQVYTIAQGLSMPSGVAFRNGSLYVAEVSRVTRYDNIESSLDKPPAPVVVNDTFPKDRHHGWKFIAFGPDGLLYVPVGAPCNICEPTAPIYASLTRMKPDSSGREIFAEEKRASSARATSDHGASLLRSQSKARARKDRAATSTSKACTARKASSGPMRSR